ncbi:MAG TPA: hypothetical protein VFH07_05645 [Chitinophagaceae bacterium]|jgi:hypothetical protein|nr:hypothetical protein [Chitinophagaceae bacterium]
MLVVPPPSRLSREGQYALRYSINILVAKNYERRHSALNYETPLDKLKKIASLLPEL